MDLDRVVVETVAGNCNECLCNTYTSSRISHQGDYRMTNTREQTINNLCIAWRHDFDLEKAPSAGNLGSGMTPAERTALRNNMTQLYDNVIQPLLEQSMDNREMSVGTQHLSGQQLKQAAESLKELTMVMPPPDAIKIANDIRDYARFQTKVTKAVYYANLMQLVEEKHPAKETTVPIPRWLVEDVILTLRTLDALLQQSRKTLKPQASAYRHNHGLDGAWDPELLELDRLIYDLDKYFGDRL